MRSSLDPTRSGSPARLRQAGLLLAGDIGGTKNALAVSSIGSGYLAPLAQAEFPSAKYGSLGLIVREFLAGTGLTVEQASFAVAGPVIAGASKVTNLFWNLNETDLKEELHLDSVHL